MFSGCWKLGEKNDIKLSLALKVGNSNIHGDIRALLPAPTRGQVTRTLVLAKAYKHALFVIRQPPYIFYIFHLLSLFVTEFNVDNPVKQLQLKHQASHDHKNVYTHLRSRINQLDVFPVDVLSTSITLSSDREKKKKKIPTFFFSWNIQKIAKNSRP